jgi:AhpC/TSA family.
MQFGILGHDAPELTVSDWIDGDGSATAHPFRLSEHTGKVRVLFAFQAWCPSCHTAGFPALKSIIEHYNGNLDIVFAAIQTVFEGHGSNGQERRFELLQQYDISVPVGQDETFPRLRGQSLTGDSDLDSRLAFGGGLGRADWGYGRRMGSDRAALAA